MSRTTTFAALAVWITLTRALGQSALSVVSLAMVGHWFVRRIDAAMAVYSVVMSIGFMMAFPLVGARRAAAGMARRVAGDRRARSSLALAPLAWAVVRRSPESIGLAPDGERVGAAYSSRSRGDCGCDDRLSVAGPQSPPRRSGSLPSAPRSTGSSRRASGSSTNRSSRERGFGADVYYQTLVVTAMTALAGNFCGGWLATRVSLARLMAIALFVLAVGPRRAAARVDAGAGDGVGDARWGSAAAS